MKKLLKSVHHLLTGFYLALEGYIELTHHHYLVGVIIGLSGLLIISYFIYIARTKGEHHTLALLAAMSEAAALFFTTYIYFIDGKHYIQYVTLFAGICYLVGAIVMIIRQRRTKRCSS